MLGSRGTYPVCGERFLEFGGATSCYIMKRGDYGLVLDGGTGLYEAGGLLGDCGRIDVLLTHVHYDHILGFLNWSVFPKDARVRLCADFDKWFGENTLERFMCRPFWPVAPKVTQIQVPSPGGLLLDDGVRVCLETITHPDDTSMLRVDTPDGAVCIACDYEQLEEPFPAHMARGCDLLVYDGTYTQEECLLHRGWGHSCWQNGWEAAQACGVGQLLVTHHSPERDDDALLALEREARTAHPGIRFARAGDEYDLARKVGNWT